MALYNILRRNDVVLNGQGRPVAGGRVFLYEPGGTSSQITAYKDSGLQTPHQQPVPLSGSGRANIWVTRDCDMYIYDRNGNLVAQELNANPTLLGADQLGGLINNGSFELDEDGNDEPDFWDRTDEAGSSNGIDDSESTDGAQSFRFTSSGDGGGTLTTSDFFPVNDTEQLRVNFDLLASVATVRNIVRVQWYDVSQVAISNTDVYDSTANPTSWSSFNTSAVPPDDARFAKLAIIGCETSGAAGSTWVDRVQVFYPSVVVGEFDNILIQDNEITTLNTNGSLAITPNGNGSVDIGNSNNPDLDDTGNSVNIGTDDPANDPHLALGPSMIQAKADGTTAAGMSINPEGGTVTFGGTVNAVTLQQGGTALNSLYLRRSNNLSDLSSASSARSNLGLGTAAVANVVTSDTDTTANRVPIVGWMGIGSRAAATISNDLTVDQPGGLYRLGSGVTGVDGIINGDVLLRSKFSDDNNTRLFVLGRDNLIPRLLVRVQDASGIWGDTVSVWHTGNTSSDVQTLLASSSNANFRSNLGLDTAATQSDTRYAHRSNNLSDLASASTARSNLGLATQSDRVELGGFFNAGSFVVCTKIQVGDREIVTITADCNVTGLGHSSTGVASSDSGDIPAAYRPIRGPSTPYAATKVYTRSGDVIARVSVDDVGRLTTDYWDTATNSSSSRTNTIVEFSLTYVRDTSA